MADQVGALGDAGVGMGTMMRVAAGQIANSGKLTGGAAAGEGSSVVQSAQQIKYQSSPGYHGEVLIKATASDGSTVGSIMGSIYDDTLHVAAISVKGSTQNQGIGTELYRRALAQGGDKIKKVVGTAGADNRAALEAGKKIGETKRAHMLEKLGYKNHSYDKSTREMTSAK
jgi:GNAT superfamily N-acetyltransferase